MAGEFRAQFDEAMREAEIEDAKKHITGIKDTVAGLNPLTDLKNEIHSSATMLNTPYIPVETASPVAPLDVSALPTVAANDSEAVKPKPARKKAAAKVSDGSPSDSQPNVPASLVAAPLITTPPVDDKPKPAARLPSKKRTTTVRPAVLDLTNDIVSKPSTKPALKAVKVAGGPAVNAGEGGTIVDPAIETRYASKKTQSGS